MTNCTKWLIAIPFTFAVSIGIPGLIAGDLFWFSDQWMDVIYVVFSAGMWLIATAFVDIKSPKGKRDLANILIPIGLILSVPISVWDRNYWIAPILPQFIKFIGLFISLAAIFLGIQARRSLGQSYSPRAIQSNPSNMVQHGPYRWIRHPLYLAALIWVIGWPLIITSFLGCLAGLFFIVPAIHKRIHSEELSLFNTYGKEYVEYQQRTWRLLPFIY